MDTDESAELQGQRARDDNPGHLLSRRALLKVAGVTAAGVVGTALVGCGDSSRPAATAADPATNPSGSPTADVALTPTIAPSPTATPVPRRDPNSLRELADKAGLTVGTLIQEGWLKDAKWQKIMSEQFNLARVARFNWDELEPQRGRLDFALIDRMVEFGQRTGMTLVAERLVPGAFSGVPNVPRWLLDGGFSAQDVEALLRSYIFQVMTRYRGVFDNWAVVAEAYPDPGRVNDFLFDVLGRDYVRIAFDEARKTDSKVTLMYVDTVNHLPQNLVSRRIIALNKDIIAMLRADGLVDNKFMLGIEGHADAIGTLPPQAIIDTLQGYGVPRLMLTEMTVDMTGVSGTPEQLGAIQAEQYVSFLEAVYDSGLCRDFSFETLSDKLNGTAVKNGPAAAPCMYDENLEPKPAYFAVQQFFKDRAAEVKS